LIVLLLLRRKSETQQPKGTTRQKRTARNGESCFVYLLKICSGWIKNLKVPPRWNPSGRFCKAGTLSQARKLLQLCRWNIRKVYLKQN